MGAYPRSSLSPLLLMKSVILCIKCAKSFHRRLRPLSTPPPTPAWPMATLTTGLMWRFRGRDVLMTSTEMSWWHLLSHSNCSSPSRVGEARFPSKRNRLRCVRCVRCVWMETGLNASACVGKQPIMVATASTENPIGCIGPSFQSSKHLCIFRLYGAM